MSTDRSTYPRRPGGQKAILAGAVLLVLGVLIWFLTSGITMDASEDTSRIGLLVALVVAIAGLITALVGLLKGLRSKDEAIEDAE